MEWSRKRNVMGVAVPVFVSHFLYVDQEAKLLQEQW
jgi:hypothetical protein